MHVVSCSQIGNHPQEDLVKFGYRPDVKVKKTFEKRRKNA
jgi:hypothetical protein